MALQPPSIPLTLRGMHRPRHRPRRSARLYFSLLSVLALVAFACVPALAQAECTDSSCAEYEIDIPTAGGKDKTGKPKGDEPTAEASKKGGGGTGSEPSSSEESSEEPEESQGGGVPGKDNGGGGSGDKNSSPGGGNATGGKEGLDGSQAVEGPTQQGQAAAAADDGGGSSPLVPILIAVAVLAAISIGAVIYRQRRQGSGSPVSPNAG
jgi:cobalamin biosynthesis Mg chelatase CobN